MTPAPPSSRTKQTWLACTLGTAILLLGGTTQAITLLPPDSPVDATLTGTLDLETYFIDQPASGLLFTGNDIYLEPRLSLMLDLQWGPHWSAFVQARIDRGFDPGARSDGDIRLDEYAMRWSPWGDSMVNVHVGKFASVFGNWIPRHLSPQNPFITAPAPYENVFGITDAAVPLGRDTFLGRKAQADKKGDWLTQIWGPSYAHGASLSGRVDQFEYAFEVKSNALSSRPSAWEAGELEWDHPTVTGRLGWRPDPALTLGISGSTGAYLREAADATLPAGSDRDDFKQDTVGIDLRYSIRHFELWSELIFTRFEVPGVGDTDLASFYVEGRYKITPSLYAALRWNQQWFDEIPDGRGGSPSWDRDLYRVDLALGYRFARNLQGKVQYSYGHEPGLNANGSHLLATQITWTF